MEKDLYKLTRVGTREESGWAYGLKEGQKAEDPYFCPVCFDRGHLIPLQSFAGGIGLKCPSCGCVIRIEPEGNAKVRYH